MKRSITSRVHLAALVLAILAIGSGASTAQAQDINEIRAKIKKLEADEEQLKEAKENLEDVLKEMEREKLILLPIGLFPFPVGKDKFSDFMAAMLLADKINEKQIAQITRQSVALTAKLKASLKQDLKVLEGKLEKTGNDLSYFLNERARLAESAANDPGVDQKKAEPEKAKADPKADKDADKPEQTDAKKPDMTKKKPHEKKP